MNNFVHSIASSVLSKDFKDYSLSDLKQLAAENPFAGSLQLLYAQKLKEENSEEFTAQWQKTLLYFSNPLLLQHTFSNVSEVQSATKVESEKSFSSAFTKDLLNRQDLPEEDIKEEAFSESDDQEPVAIPGLKIEAIDPEKAALSFTPYHTIDYFASLGIKLSEETKSADKFGNQLKSFTSWLKEMRRLPEAEVVSKFSKTEQNSIEKMAENSLTGENAITEAMAQVWIKQNNKPKAIDIYKKLSLQNPTKSAFFAAKIDHLKKQI